MFKESEITMLNKNWDHQINIFLKQEKKSRKLLVLEMKLLLDYKNKLIKIDWETAVKPDTIIVSIYLSRSISSSYLFKNSSHDLMINQLKLTNDEIAQMY